MEKLFGLILYLYIRHRKKLLVHLLQSIDTLFELEIVVRKLGLFIRLAQLLLDELLSARRKRRELRAIKSSANIQKVRGYVVCAHPDLPGNKT